MGPRSNIPPRAGGVGCIGPREKVRSCARCPLCFCRCFRRSVLDASPALAAAFELSEFSANAMGTAYAGVASGSDDAGFLFYNPAALGGVQDLDGSVALSGLILDSSGTFDGTTASARKQAARIRPPASSAMRCFRRRLALSPHRPDRARLHLHDALRRVDALSGRMDRPLLRADDRPRHLQFHADDLL